MGGYLLDTSAISALAPGKPAFDPAVARWFRAHTDALHLPAITIAEIEQGIREFRRTGAAVRADALARWLDEVLLLHANRILPFDAEVARRFGAIADHALAAGLHPGFPDVAIAAIAARHDLVILTRNIRHFEPLGAPCHDPFMAG